MATYDTVSHLFNYTWKHVVTCYWRKYPNEFSTHVLSEDVLDRRVLDGGKLYTKRLIGKTNHMPKWGTAIVSSHVPRIVQILEETIVDLRQQTMVSYTWNVTHRTFMDVKERVTLTASSLETTECNKEGWVDSSATGFRRILRKFGIGRWRSNANKALLGYEKILLRLDPKSIDDALYEEKVMRLPKLGENTIETIKDAKDKAKTKAIDLASLATLKKQKNEPQNIS